MKRSNWKGTLLMTAVFVGALSLFSCGAQDTYLEFMLRDAVSDAWVWDATVTIQDRTTSYYYQTGGELGYVRVSGLTPGEAELSVEAPYYGSFSANVTLERGPNRLEEPVRLSGLEIPGLDRFLIFAETLPESLELEIRPLERDGTVIKNHPAMPVWIGAIISEQMYDGAPASQPVEQGSTRGREIYREFADITFDSDPATRYRYRGNISADRILPSDAPLWVVDYLIILPDFTKVASSQVLEAMQSLMSAPTAELPEMIATGFNGVDTYFYTSWNVTGVPR